MALLAQRPDGRLAMHKLVPMEEEIVDLPEHMAGPFVFEFSIGDSTGLKDFQGRVLINDAGFVIAFKNFPVMAATIEELLPEALIERITEREGNGSTLKLLTLDVAETFLKGEWLVISQQEAHGGLLAFLADESGKTYTLPFYNFYENGTVCTGTIELGGGPWQRIQNILTSRTTPHATFSDKSLKFRPKEGRVIKDDGGKVKNKAIDLPEVRELVKRLVCHKPIGKIQPL